MTAILFTIAAIMLVWLVIVSPGVIRTHRVWRRYEALLRSVDGLEAALRSFADAVAQIGVSADRAREGFAALAEVFAPTPEEP